MKQLKLWLGASQLPASHHHPQQPEEEDSNEFATFKALFYNTDNDHSEAEGDSFLDPAKMSSQLISGRADEAIARIDEKMGDMHLTAISTYCDLHSIAEKLCEIWQRVREGEINMISATTAVAVAIQHMQRIEADLLLRYPSVRDYNDYFMGMLSPIVTEGGGALLHQLDLGKQLWDVYLIITEYGQSYRSYQDNGEIDVRFLRRKHRDGDNPYHEVSSPSIDLNDYDSLRSYLIPELLMLQFDIANIQNLKISSKQRCPEGKLSTGLEDVRDGMFMSFHTLHPLDSFMAGMSNDVSMTMVILAWTWALAAKTLHESDQSMSSHMFQLREISRQRCKSYKDNEEATEAVMNKIFGDNAWTYAHVWMETNRRDPEHDSYFIHDYSLFHRNPVTCASRLCDQLLNELRYFKDTFFRPVSAFLVPALHLYHAMKSEGHIPILLQFEELMRLFASTVFQDASEKPTQGCYVSQYEQMRKSSLHNSRAKRPSMMSDLSPTEETRRTILKPENQYGLWQLVIAKGNHSKAQNSDENIFLSINQLLEDAVQAVELDLSCNSLFSVDMFVIIGHIWDLNVAIEQKSEYVAILTPGCGLHCIKIVLSILDKAMVNAESLKGLTMELFVKHMAYTLQTQALRMGRLFQFPGSWKEARLSTFTLQSVATSYSEDIGQEMLEEFVQRLRVRDNDLECRNTLHTEVTHYLCTFGLKLFLDSSLEAWMKAIIAATIYGRQPVAFLDWLVCFCNAHHIPLADSVISRCVNNWNAPALRFFASTIPHEDLTIVDAKDGNSAAHYAVTKRDTKGVLIQLLWTFGAHLEQCNDEGLTPLDYAVECQRELVHNLIIHDRTAGYNNYWKLVDTRSTHAEAAMQRAAAIQPMLRNDDIDNTLFNITKGISSRKKGSSQKKLQKKIAKRNEKGENEMS